jgi:hypothetical protein
VFEVAVSLEPFGVGFAPGVLIIWCCEECGSSLKVTLLYIGCCVQCEMTTLKKYGKIERRNEQKYM